MSIEALNNLQLGCFLAGGYLVSRLMIKSKLPEAALLWLIGRKPLSAATVLLYLTGLTSVLGIFIHHAIVVLTLLPLARMVQGVMQKASPQHERIVPSLMAVCLMYGANIGGMGAITSSAANGVLLAGANGLLQPITGVGYVAGTEKLTFFLWMAWGVPLVLVYTLLAWVLMLIFFRPWRWFKDGLRFEEHHSQTNPYRQASAYLAALTFGAAFLISMFSTMAPPYTLALTILAFALNASIIGLLFFKKVETEDGPKPLLTFADCISDMPKSGISLVVISLIVAALVGWLMNFYREPITDFTRSLFPSATSPVLLFFILAIFATFATELASNTVVQLILFAVLPSFSAVAEFPLLLGMVVVTLASSSAFMSPLSTGVNSLAYGEMKGASLRVMLFIGFFMNLAASFLVAFWTLTFTRWVLGL